MKEGLTNEMTLGAPVNHAIDTDRTVDYYAVVHRISENVTKQPLYAHWWQVEGLLTPISADSMPVVSAHLLPV